MRLEARGKFLFLEGQKFHLKAARVDGPEEVFAGVADLGVNAVWLSDPTLERLDLFAGQGLRVVAALGFERCLERLFAGEAGAFETWREETRARIATIRGHHALLAYDLGGPVPAPIRRWLGDRALERRLERAFRAVKRLDPGRLATATQRPETFSLGLSFLDFFTAELREPTLADFRVAAARLQNKAGGYPLVVRTAGADSAALGEAEQAHRLDQQIRMGFIAGCAGVALESWRDEAGASAALGLLTHDGRRKEAFEAARVALAEMPFPPYPSGMWPRFSIVVCVHNGEKDIEECLDGAARLDYPDFEVIVVNDGSTDRTLELAQAKAERHGFRVVSLEKSGISRARNKGMECATGEFIAYLDSDAFPDRDWLRYLALTFLGTKHAVVGGPNLNPLSCGPRADCIDQAPGNPQLVMAKEELADHVPGCNLAVRRSFMRSMGGFDHGYRGGGDDVHFCWRILRAGGTLGHSPGAMVWHYRRQTVRGFLRQQMSYGRGEAPLERDWPERFNSLGHQVRARTGLSADARAWPSPLGPRVYQGVPADGTLASALGQFPAMPEWPFFVAVFGALSALGRFWRPFLVFLPFFLAGLLLWLAYAVAGGRRARLRSPSLRARALVAFLHVAQPLARLYGRLQAGLTPWRRRCPDRFAFPVPRTLHFPVSAGLSHADAVELMGQRLRERGLPALRGADALGWDWQLEGGLFGGARCLVHVEGTRAAVRVWPYAGAVAGLLAGICAAAVAAALAAGAPALAAALAAPLALVGERVLRHMGAAAGSLLPLLRSEHWTFSHWEDFRPPRHFFEKPLIPESAR
jgi:GT2 family glycosyltransferase